MNAIPIVSMVKDAFTVKTEDVRADKVVAAIRNGRWKQEVEEIRRETDKESANKLKTCLPGVTFSGKCSERNNDALVQHSGLLCADLDKLNGQFQNAREQLLASPCLWALFTSPSGGGLKAVFRVPVDGAKHRGGFRAVEQHVRELTGVQIDEACKDVARLCFVSYDPDAFHNPNAQELAPLPEPERPKSTSNGIVDLSERQRIATGLLGKIDWQSDTSGLVVCPGKHLHTSGDKARDCQIDFDGVPTVHCFHTSCRGILDGVNHELRSRIGKAEYIKPGPVQPRPLSELLDAITAILRRYVVFQFPEQPNIIALWVLHAWTLESFDHTPYLNVFAASKRSGKSRVLELLELLCRNPRLTSGGSSAALIRSVDEENPPTILLDEVDAIYSKKNDAEAENTRQFLNAGYRRGAKFLRCVGQSSAIEVKEFPAFCPKAFAGIGRCLPDTVLDRSLPIELVRQSREEKAERFRDREARGAVADIVRELEALAQQRDLIEALRQARPTLPEELNDRAQDISEPLLAIGDVAGGDWPEKARIGLVKLCGQEEDADFGVKLLAAIKAIFDEAGEEKLPSIEVLQALVSIEDGPWASMFEDALKNSKVQTAASKLARVLKNYKIKSRTLKLADETTAKGYHRADFEPHWRRYLAASSSVSVQAVTAVTHEGKKVTAPVSVTATDQTAVTLFSPREVAKGYEVTAVTASLREAAEAV